MSRQQGSDGPRRLHEVRLCKCIFCAAACAAAQQPQAGCAYQAAGQEDASSAWSMFSSFVNSSTASTRSKRQCQRRCARRACLFSPGLQSSDFLCVSSDSPVCVSLSQVQASILVRTVRVPRGGASFDTDLRLELNQLGHFCERAESRARRLCCCSICIAVRMLIQSGSHGDALPHVDCVPVCLRPEDYTYELGSERDALVARAALVRVAPPALSVLRS